MNLVENLSEKDIMTDCLVMQKHLTEAYNEAANETAHNLLRSDLINILTEEHQLQSSVFGTLDKRGWYLTRPVTREALNQTQSHFRSAQGQLQ
ncbi:MAG TPA: spore coat protein [Firmicutes bacterium]|nr:spore coat protein [Bacillota bacterium]